MTNEELDKLVAQELEEWARIVVLRLASEIRRKKVVMSEKLLKSLQQEVLQQTASGAQAMYLAFNESGRMKDMTALSYKKMPPIEAIEEFVKYFGLSKFNYVPGYNKGTMPLNQSKAINRIAWGIAANKLAVNTHKPKKWFSKAFYGMIDPLIDNVVTKYQEATGEVIGGVAKF
ncbi:hypothetical protein [Pontibacter mangrovi]|uniref:HK97 gp10 family phage protein n=1 Tax=Pontibacter mangrovi TaxID=2589816 RepID=A0A501W302_9BACT|nr:hypothetical protein [Pontibacter mangrovi]TPE43989.1 hypothetical protein FJM65_11225 [Pontibacter mangrovi]